MVATTPSSASRALRPGHRVARWPRRCRRVPFRRGRASCATRRRGRRTTCRGAGPSGHRGAAAVAALRADPAAGVPGAEEAVRADPLVREPYHELDHPSRPAVLRLEPPLRRARHGDLLPQCLLSGKRVVDAGDNISLALMGLNYYGRLSFQVHGSIRLACYGRSRWTLPLRGTLSLYPSLAAAGGYHEKGQLQTHWYRVEGAIESSARAAACPPPAPCSPGALLEETPPDLPK